MSSKTSFQEQYSPNFEESRSGYRPDLGSRTGKESPGEKTGPQERSEWDRKKIPPPRSTTVNNDTE